MKKVLIIGAKGMLGSDLVEIFSGDKNYEVIAWDTDDIDIADESQVSEKIKKEKPDIIINSAAYNAVDKCEEDPNEKRNQSQLNKKIQFNGIKSHGASKNEFELAKRINGDGPKFLAEIAKELGAILVHYVSDYVFDGVIGEYKEEAETNPISNYGISKEMGEKNVKKIGGNYYLIRTSKLFGRPAQSETAKKSFFEIMLNLSKNNSELKVVDGEKSCFTYTPDLAKATKKLIEEKYPYGIYHLINEGAVTWYEGLKELFKIAKIEDVKLIPVSSSEFPRPAKRPNSSVLINTKFSKLRNYKEALRDWLNILNKK